MAKCPLACAFYGHFIMFTISASDRLTAYIFLAMVTEGVVHGVYKIVTQSSFSVMW